MDELVIGALMLVVTVAAAIYVIRLTPARPVRPDAFATIDHRVLTAGIVSSSMDNRRIRLHESLNHLTKRERAHEEHIRFSNFWNEWVGAGSDTGYLEARREWMLVSKGGRYGC